MPNMPKKLTCVVILYIQIFLLPHCYGQEDGCDSLVHAFRENVLFELKEHNGLVVWDDETIESYCLVMMTCKVEDLLQYVDDTIAFIRSEMFSGLAQKSSDLNLLREILNKHENDTAKYVVSPTDVVVTWTVREHMQMVFDAKSIDKLNVVDYQARLKKIRSEPKVIIPGVRHGYVTKESLLSVDSLVCSVDGYAVISFTLYARKKMVSKSNAITGRMKRQLKKLDHGEIVYFGDLNVEMPDKTSRKWHHFSLKIR